jgi:hypothetical protein
VHHVPLKRLVHVRQNLNFIENNKNKIFVKLRKYYQVNEQNKATKKRCKFCLFKKIHSISFTCKECNQTFVCRPHAKAIIALLSWLFKSAKTSFFRGNSVELLYRFSRLLHNKLCVKGIKFINPKHVKYARSTHEFLVLH